MFILMFSCPEQLVVGSVWTGESSKNREITIYFYPNNEIEIFYEFEDSSTGDMYYFDLDGEYELTNDGLFKSSVSKTLKLDIDPYNDKIKLKVEGNLDYYSGISTGDYELSIDLSASSIYNETGEFDMTKVR